MPSTVDAQIIDVINQAQAATMQSQVVQTSGAGKAYQSVAQSAAIAVQDATDALRNVATIAMTASSVALAQYLATKDEAYMDAAEAAQKMMKSATDDFKSIGLAASTVLKGFPPG